MVASIEGNLGLTLTVEIARQGGKNELSAHLEVLLLTMFLSKGGSGIKCSPTFKPQTLISMSRLKERLDEYGYGGIWSSEAGYIVKLGNVRWVFLSAEETSSVVGHTADILLEVDEAQDVSRDKYTKEFRPMASAHNTTTVLYGTTWDDSTLLEEIKQANLELEKRDGVKRHFRYDWQEVAKYTRHTGNLWRWRDRGWERTTPCFAPSMLYCRYGAVEGFSTRRNWHLSGVNMPGGVCLKRGRCMWWGSTLPARLSSLSRKSCCGAAGMPR